MYVHVLMCGVYGCVYLCMCMCVVYVHLCASVWCICMGVYMCVCVCILLKCVSIHWYTAPMPLPPVASQKENPWWQSTLSYFLKRKEKKRKEISLPPGRFGSDSVWQLRDMVKSTQSSWSHGQETAPHCRGSHSGLNLSRGRKFQMREWVTLGVRLQGT